MIVIPMKKKKKQKNPPNVNIFRMEVLFAAYWKFLYYFKYKYAMNR